MMEGPAKLPRAPSIFISAKPAWRHHMRARSAAAEQYLRASDGDTAMQNHDAGATELAHAKTTSKDALAWYVSRVHLDFTSTALA